VPSSDSDRIRIAVVTDVYVRLDRVTQRRSYLNSIES